MSTEPICPGGPQCACHDHDTATDEVEQLARELVSAHLAVTFSEAALYKAANDHLSEDDLTGIARRANELLTGIRRQFETSDQHGLAPANVVDRGTQYGILRQDGEVLTFRDFEGALRRLDGMNTLARDIGFPDAGAELVHRPWTVAAPGWNAVSADEIAAERARIENEPTF